MSAAKKKAAAVVSEQNGGEFAKQLRERNRKASDGGIHAVTHTVKGRSRKQEAAASKEVVRPAKRRWKRASLLPAMPEIPGKHLEYVRRDNRNRGDYANMNAHLRSGWEFAKTSMFEEEHLPTQQIAGHGECIGNDDTVLMMIDEDMWAERNAEYEGNRDATTRAVNDKNLKLDVSHPAMPLVDLENRSSSGFRQMRARRAKGNSVNVASD